jgi:hypothetical protein
MRILRAFRARKNSKTSRNTKAGFQSFLWIPACVLVQLVKTAAII